MSKLLSALIAATFAATSLLSVAADASPARAAAKVEAASSAKAASTAPAVRTHKHARKLKAR
jgi:Ni/Co efflux regulator RcnB